MSKNFVFFIFFSIKWKHHVFSNVSCFKCFCHKGRLILNDVMCIYGLSLVIFCHAKDCGWKGFFHSNENSNLPNVFYWAKANDSKCAYRKENEMSSTGSFFLLSQNRFQNLSWLVLLLTLFFARRFQNDFVLESITENILNLDVLLIADTATHRSDMGVCVWDI